MALAPHRDSHSLPRGISAGLVHPGLDAPQHVAFQFDRFSRMRLWLVVAINDVSSMCSPHERGEVTLDAAACHQ